MKYHDQQPVEKGDKCIAGTWGTCIVLSSSRHVTKIQNTVTDEKWEMDSMGNFDLIERKQSFAARNTDHPHAGGDHITKATA